MIRYPIKKLSILLSILYLFLTVSVFASQSFAADILHKLNVYTTNDIHGHFLLEPDNPGLVDAMLIGAAKAYDNSSLLLDAGDAAYGMPLTASIMGVEVIKLMNAMGYDAVTLGNHEFDDGLQPLENKQKIATFPFICSNVLKDNKSYFTENFIITKTIGGMQVKIGVFGLLTSNMENTLSMLKLSINKNYVSVAKEEAKKLKAQGADIIIALSHVGFTKHEDGKKLFDEVPDLHLVIDGHSHDVYIKQFPKTGTVTKYIIQNGTESMLLGHVIFTIDDKKKVKSIEAKQLDRNALKNYRVPDALAKEFKRITTAVDSKYPSLNYNIPFTLFGGTSYYYNGGIKRKEPSRLGPTYLGDFIASVMRDYAKSYLEKDTKYDNVSLISMINGGSIRTGLNRGIVSSKDLFQIAPNDAKLVILKITPAELFKMLNTGLLKIGRDGNSQGYLMLGDMILLEPDKNFPGRFPHIAGLDGWYTYGGDNKPMQPPSFVSLSTVKGAKVDIDNATKNQDILLVTSAYLASKGDGYDIQGEKIADLEYGEYRILKDKIEALKKANVNFGSYIDTLRDFYTWSEYDYDVHFSYYSPSVKILYNGNPLAKQSIEVMVFSYEGNERIMKKYLLQTDKDGVFIIDDEYYENPVVAEIYCIPDSDPSKRLYGIVYLDHKIGAGSTSPGVAIMKNTGQDF